MTDVNVYYILDRLDEMLDDTRRKEDHVLRSVERLKRELIYNLGVEHWRKFKEEEVEQYAKEYCSEDQAVYQSNKGVK